LSLRFTGRPRNSQLAHALRCVQRAAASQQGEAREHLLSRADEIRNAERRAGELALERDALQTRIADLE
jgi:hypothetical protein